MKNGMPAAKISEILKSLAVKQAIQVELGNKRKSLPGEGEGTWADSFQEGMMSIFISDIVTSPLVMEAIESELSKQG
jgi:hypothetical protein